MHNEFTAVFSKVEESGYWAYCLEIPANGQGETLEEGKQNLIAAIHLMLLDRREEERHDAPPEAWEEVIEVKE